MKYFMMSRRFNKSNPEDFGLILKDNVTLSPIDGSIWQPAELYDFGWGPENGYSRLPQLSFNKLFELGFTDEDEDNVCGAAATILNKYPNELLNRIEREIRDGNLNKYIKFLKILKLEYPLNRTFKTGQNIDAINVENERWNSIAEIIRRYK